MARKDSGDGPSLELPSLGFGRKRRSRERTASEPGTDPGATAGSTSEPAPEAGTDPAPQSDVPAREPAAFTPAPPLPPVPAQEATTRTEVLTAAPTAPEPEAAPRRRRVSRPRLAGMPAAALTGLVSGLLLVGLVWLATHGCDLLGGTSSCGKPGFLLLLGILVAVVVAGRLLLAWLAVPDPGSTSFLALGLVAVVSLMFLSGVMFETWTAAVVVALTVGAFMLAHWVTTAFVDPGGSDHHR